MSFNLGNDQMGSMKISTAIRLTVVFVLGSVIGLAGFSLTAHAQQVFPPPAPSTTPVWEQNFSGFKAGVVWPDIDGDKVKQDGGALIVACPSSPAGVSPAVANCFQVIFNKTGGPAGVPRAVPSNPVLYAPVPGSPDCAPSGVAVSGLPCVGWTPAGVPPANDEAKEYTTNTGGDVVQNDIVINPSINGTTEDPISESATPYTGPLMTPSYYYTLTYYVYFPAGFDFAKGGKLPGLASDDFDSGCTDDGSIKRTPNRWSERVMWRENGRVELYSYDQSRPSGNCGIDELVDAAAGDPAYEYPNVVPGDSKFRFQTGVWYEIEVSVTVNENNSVIYATDDSGNTLLDSFGDPIVIGTTPTGGGLVYLGITNASTGALVGSIQYNNVALRDECDTGSASDWKGSSPVCGSPVPDTAEARVNTVFFSTFFGGNETKRLTCLNDTLPETPTGTPPAGLTQAIYEELCATQRVEYIWPTNTWVPQTASQVYFADLNVYTGYQGLPGTPPSFASATALTATPVSSTEIDLSWTAATPGTNGTGTDPIAGYKVYSNGGILLGQTASTSFQVTNIAGIQLTASTPYYFFVKAYSVSGDQSGFTNEAYAVTTSSPSATILPPGSVTSNTLPNATNIVLWAPQPDAVSYQMYRNGTAIPGAAQTVAPVTVGCGALPAQQTYIDTGSDIGGLKAGTSYTYAITAKNAAGQVSSLSQPSTATPSNGVTSNFVVSVTPPYCQTVAPGASATYPVFVTDPSATLSVVTTWPYSTSLTSTQLDYGALYTALPAGVTVKFGSSIVNDMTTMTVTTTSATPAGIYPININASNGTVTLWTQFELVVAQSSGTTAATVTATPSALSITSGGASATSSIAESNFTGTVTLTDSLGASGCTGVSASISSTTLTVSATGVTSAETCNVTVTGTAGSQSATVTIPISVTPASTETFALSASPSSLSLAQDGESTVTITVTSIGGFDSAVALTITGMPSSFETPKFSASPVTPVANGSATSTLTLKAKGGTTPGTYTLTVTGTSGSTVVSTTITLTVTAKS